VSEIQLEYPGKSRTAVAVREKQHLTYLVVVVAKHEVKAGPSAYLLPTHRLLDWSRLGRCTFQ
jgi:hypothetical protein